MKTLERRPIVGPRGWSVRPRPLIGRRGIVGLLVVALAGGLFVSVPPSKVAADALSDAYAQQKQLEKQIAAEKAKMAALAASQQSLSTKLSNTKATLGSVVEDLTSVKVDIVGMVVDVANAQAGVDELEATVAQLDRELTDLQTQVVAKQDQLDARKAMLAERIRTAYETDRTSLLETILSSNDFTDVLSQVDYHLDFAAQDKALADQIVEDQQVLIVLRQNTLLLRIQTDSARAAADAGKAQLAQQLRAEKKLQGLIDKLVLEALKQGGIPSQYSGTLHWPMAGVITQPFGCTGFYLEPPLGSCAHFHRGIDIATDAGTPIHAAGAGKVIYVGKAPYDPAYIVIIAHAKNLWSGYWHVQPNIPVRVGQFVNTGTVIAYEGCTGWCTGPHLHWQVDLNDNPVNPRLFL